MPKQTKIYPPQEENLNWRTYTESLLLTYIPTNTNYSKQGGYNYMQTSLIDGFFIKDQNPTTYTFNTFVKSNLNSDHLPIILQIPPNKLISRQTPPSITPTNQIMNPIPQENLEQFKAKFFEENAIQLNNITILLSPNQLTQNQWQSTCSQMDHIIQKIFETIENTCSTSPQLTLTNRISQQGGSLPKKLQKLYKKHIKTYHLIKKVIYIAHNVANWRIHPIMNELNSHDHTNIP